MPELRGWCLLILFILMFLTPAKRCAASFYTPRALQATTALSLTDHAWPRQRRVSHFRGYNHTFWGVAGLTCSIIGSVALVAALAAAAASLPPVVPVLGIYVFNIAGLVMGLVAHDDTAGTTAVELSLINILIFFAGVAIYDLATGNYAGFAKILSAFVKHL